MVRVTVLYLSIVGGTYGFQGILLIVSAGFNGLNRPLHSAALSLTRMLILYIPMALLLRLYFGVVGVFSAAAAANLLSGLIAYLLISHILRTLAGSALHGEDD